MKQPRIIVDCTHTFRTGARTGIQRVVRRYADELLGLAQGSGIAVVPVRLSDGYALPLPIEDGRVAFPDAPSARERDIAVATPLPPWIRRLAGPDRGPNTSGLARLYIRMKRPARPARALTIGRDDVLLSLDSSWVYDVRSVLDEARDAGATTISVVCDVLPLTRPQWFTEGTKRYFGHWLQAILPRIDAVVAISKATCADLRAVVETGTIAVRSAPPCIPVHLGAEIAPPSEAGVRPILQHILAPDRPPAFLTVGTLEPRKNVDFALDLFDVLDKEGLDFQWHIVGSPGWMAEKTIGRIRSHPAFGERLHWWTDMSDAELAWCYSHAAALVAVSKAEGFGLPLVEARLHGLPVFASDIAVFREVLGPEGRYLPLSSAALAAAALEDFLLRSLPGGRPAEPSHVARPWRHAAEELLEAVLCVHRQRAAARA